MARALVGNVVYGFDAEVIAWVAARIPAFDPSPGARALGVVRGTDLVAGVIYEHWNGVHVQAAIAAAPVPWATKGTMFRLFHFPFCQLGCEAISVLVPSSNLPSLNLATKMGFAPEAIIRLAAHDGSDLIILKQWKAECRWIGGQDHGEEERRLVRKSA